MSNFTRLLRLAAALAVTTTPVLRAQQGEAPTSTGETGLFTLVDARGLERGEWTLGLRYDNWDRLVAAVPGRTLLPVESDDWDFDRHRVALTVGYGLTDRFEIALAVPWERLEASDPNRVGVVNGRLFEDRIDASGAGNVRLGGKLRLTTGSDGDRGVAALAFVELPSGDDDEGVVTGDTGWGGGLLGLSFSPWRRAAAAPPPAPVPQPVAPPVAAAPPAPAPVAPPAPPAAAAAPIVPAAPAAPRESVETIHFDSGGARPTNIAKAKLDEVALRLKQEPTATLRILGHADASGTSGDNQALSLRRAEAAAGNESADGRRENRRAVLVLTIGG